MQCDAEQPAPPIEAHGIRDPAARVMAELEALLGCRVDVVETNALHKELRDRVLQEATPL